MKKKLTPRQKQHFREVLNDLVDESKARASRRELFLEELRELLDVLNGQQKVWLFRELEKQCCKGPLQ